jgi:hypothetical protein
MEGGVVADGPRREPPGAQQFAYHPGMLLWIVPLIVGVIAVLLALGGDRATTPGPDPTVQAAPDPPVQEQFMTGINDDRGQLYAGVASANLSRTAEIGKAFPLDLTVCATVSPPCGAVTASAAPAAALGSLLVGGRVRAELTSYEPTVRITALGDPVQTITRPTDVGEWRWTVTAPESGTFRLLIGVTALRADSEIALTPTKYFEVTVRVENTAARVLGMVTGSLWTVVGGTAGLTAVVTAVIAVMVYRRDRRGAARMAGNTAGNAAGGSRHDGASGRARKRKR